MSLGATAVQTAAGMLGQPLYSGRCEQFVRSCFGFPAMYSSAALAWTNARGRHEGDWDPPAGVPVFWDIVSGPNAPYDHIALSVGGGECITTSAGKGKTITRIGIKELTKLWGMRYLGWAEIYHDVTVWAPPTPTTPAPEEDDVSLPENQSQGLDWLADRAQRFDTALSQIEQLWERRALIDRLGSLDALAGPIAAAVTKALPAGVTVDVDAIALAVRQELTKALAS